MVSRQRRLLCMCGIALREAGLGAITSLAHISQYHTISSHCPANLLVEVQRKKILFGAVFLLNPRSSAIVRAHNDPASPDDPALVVINELHTQESGAHL